MDITPELVKVEIEKLSNIIKEKAKRDRNSLTSKRKLLLNLQDLGFKRITENKFALDFFANGISYLSITVDIEGRAANIYEDHIVIIDGKELPTSRIGNSFRLHAVRFSRVLMEIYKRILEVSKELKKDA